MHQPDRNVHQTGGYQLVNTREQQNGNGNRLGSVRNTKGFSHLC